VPELGPLGSVRGAFSNERPYREHIQIKERKGRAEDPSPTKLVA
jgi:hypothetical protein